MIISCNKHYCGVCLMLFFYFSSLSFINSFSEFLTSVIFFSLIFKKRSRHMTLLDSTAKLFSWIATEISVQFVFSWSTWSLPQTYGTRVIQIFINNSGNPPFWLSPFWMSSLHSCSCLCPKFCLLVLQARKTEELSFFYDSFSHPMWYCPQAKSHKTRKFTQCCFLLPSLIRICLLLIGLWHLQVGFFSHFIPPVICRRVTLVGAYSIILETKLDHLYNTDSFKYVKTCFMA